MKSVLLVFVITVLFLIGMTKFTNDTNYNEAIRYMELSEYYDQMQNGGGTNGGGENVFLETIELEVTFSGAVKKTKSISVAYGSYLSYAIEQAGGLLEDADERCINKYYVILENRDFYIPFGSDLDKISINKADIDELMNLESIGSITASRIIEYRNTYGGFETLESIMNVTGIGTSTFNKIKDSIIL